jgi:hypothetical protein
MSAQDELDTVLLRMSRNIESNLWRFVADDPPNQDGMRSACIMAAQLRISRICTEEHGCTGGQAESFIVETDKLVLALDRFGGAKRLSQSLIWQAHTEAAAFADALLDMLGGRA